MQQDLSSFRLGAVDEALSKSKEIIRNNGDASLAAMKNEKGAWDLGAIEKLATLKTALYHDYDKVGWAFLPLITSTSCNLSYTCLRLLFFLAELQTERALQSAIGEC